MIVFLILGIIAVVNSLEPLVDNNIDEESKTVLNKYINLIPDIESRFVIDDSLTKVIDYYFKGKVNTLPLYKLSLTIDRNPVKIPWSTDQVGENHNKDEIQKALNEQLDKKTKGKHYKVKMISKLSMAKKKRTTKPPLTTEATSAPSASSATPASGEIE
ncbi:unnamed protein product [Spodoptera littoralis]|uniref:Uncharacterized protein n=1 Tax=Spodoptera littoralis TaxID=7109 RepID=A0A9P0N8D0_SPOLI|nr:unnamed protein product [Spodoptera littoralis]CAH1643521.1 unnamed protein product [Spodoptera littoralis]